MHGDHLAGAAHTAVPLGDDMRRVLLDATGLSISELGLDSCAGDDYGQKR